MGHRYGLGLGLLVGLLAASSGPQGGLEPKKGEEETGGISTQAVYPPGRGTWAAAAFSWVDPVQGGTRLTALDDDDAYTTVPLPFPFPWGGTAVTAIAMSTNGALAGPGDGDTTWSNTPLPWGTRNRWAAVFWDDLYNDCPQGGIYTKTLTSGGQPVAFVVGWVGLRRFGGSGSCLGQGPVTFEAILYPDGRLLYQFLDTDFGQRSWNAGASATVGLQGAPGGYPQAYALYIYNSFVVLSRTALLYTPPAAVRGLSQGQPTPLCVLPSAQEGNPYGPVQVYGPADLATLPNGLTRTPFRGGVTLAGTPGVGTAGHLLAEPRSIAGGCFLQVQPD